MSVELELTCPACLHHAGVLLVDESLYVKCPGCDVLLGLGPTKLLMPLNGFEPPQRQLTRRVDKPKRTKVRLRRAGDALRAGIRFGIFGILTPFAKKAELSPAGYTMRTWRGGGSELPLGDVVGVIVLQMFLGWLIGDKVENRAQLVWISTLVYRRSDDVMYRPMYMHSREDAEYLASALNAHLAELKSAAPHPYRGA
ncbi:MAG TPA: hypothetical protein VFV99_28510 [Kofleriaceae bacterium]|nr:hypothetical protein [Kofleriaceae bacterium]